MTNVAPEDPQGDDQAPNAPPPDSRPDQAADSQTSRGGNTILKSGPLFISSKGIGWSSWKKRWFILTKTSLVFFRSDPSAAQKGSEVNLTLGGIDLNNSGSVVVKEDKKLLTVLFPDGRDGRAFTLKAETSKDLLEWKEALENALSQAPNCANPVAQNGILGNDQKDSKESNLDQPEEKPPAKSKIIGVPILLALEDVDGAPCFLEKALKFIEEYGVKVEGILRQAADVDDVERRIRDFEEGKVEFSPDEDPHVVSDCVKYILREMPSSPVPASCCNALLDSFRKSGNDRFGRINAMRTTICDTFPEPNRRLLQRMLLMMQTIVSHKAVNRMSCSAVAACMAPLLLRPLLAGDCEINNDFSMGGDNSVQLLQAAAAANHAQAMVITLLEEYDNIFGEGSVSNELYSDSEDDETGTEGETDDDEYYDDDDDETESREYDDDDDVEIVSGSCTESDEYDEYSDNEDERGSSSDDPDVGDDNKAHQKLSSRSLKHAKPQVGLESNVDKPDSSESKSAELENDFTGVVDVSGSTSSVHQSRGHGLPGLQKSKSISSATDFGAKGNHNWVHTTARKNASAESIGFGVEEQDEQIQRLENKKAKLEDSIVEEVQDNVARRENLEKQKLVLFERRRAIELDVARLEEQLKKEKEFGATLEAGLKISEGHAPDLTTFDARTRPELGDMIQAAEDCTNLKKKADGLDVQLNLQIQKNYGSCSASDTLDVSSPRRDHNKKQHTKERKDKDKDSEAGAPPHLERSRSKDHQQDGTENENERKTESGSKSSKKGGEGNKGMTKLTSRLNFLKERRPTEGGDKVPGSPKKGKRAEKLTKADSHIDHRGKKSEGQQQHILDRGKSDGHMSIEVDKGHALNNSSSSMFSSGKPLPSPRRDNR